MRAARYLLITVMALSLVACGRERSPEETTLSESTDPDQRYRAAVQIAENDRIDDDRAVELLAQALKRELREPTEGPPPAGSWFTASEVGAWNYVTAAGLRGAGAIPELRRQWERADGADAEWLLLARASAGDSVGSKLVDLLDSATPAIRAMAARRLPEQGHPGAIDALIPLLDDPFATRGASSDLQGGGNDAVNYPVRTAAADALRTLGVTVLPMPGRPGEYEVRR